jgi:hypothetical protein
LGYVSRRERIYSPARPMTTRTKAEGSGVVTSSPVSGLSPGAPKAKGVISGAPADGVFRRYQVSVAGSTAPIPVFPEPVQSPVTGIQPGAPNAKVISVAPADAVFRRYQNPVEGSNTPIPSFPAPVQSPTSGIQPGLPKAKAPASGGPEDRVFLRNQVALPESKAPIPSWPLPSQLPKSGRQEPAPKLNVLSGGPAEALDRKFHVPEEFSVPMIGVIVALVPARLNIRSQLLGRTVSRPYPLAGSIIADIDPLH